MCDHDFALRRDRLEVAGMSKATKTYVIVGVVLAIVIVIAIKQSGSTPADVDAGPADEMMDTQAQAPDGSGADLSTEIGPNAGPEPAAGGGVEPFGPEPPPADVTQPPEPMPEQPARAPAAPATKTPQATEEKPPTAPAAEESKPPQLPRFVEVGAKSCIPCKMMQPVLDELRKAYAGRLEIEFADVWENPALGDKYEVRTIPTQVIYDGDGNEVFRHIGYWPKEEIDQKLKELGILD